MIIRRIFLIEILNRKILQGVISRLKISKAKGVQHKCSESEIYSYLFYHGFLGFFQYLWLFGVDVYNK